MVELDVLVAAAHERYRATHRNSARANDRARQVMPGGNTRSVLHFEPFPFRVQSAADAGLQDVDGNHYLDFVGNYTAGLLGHSPERVKTAIAEALESGWAMGATHTREIELAELICERFESIEQVRFTNSGTEANLMAIGTALARTGRGTIGVFDRGYHGGVLAFGPDPLGPHHPLNVPHRFEVGRFDDRSGLDAMFANTDLACVLIEAVQGSGGCRPASPEFLADLRQRCSEHDVVLIFDEVMTSRLAVGGAQERFGVVPDMTTLGKYLGGGMTFGAFGGKRRLMAEFDPAQGGTLTQAGTFNNNIVSMSAAIATLRHELDAERLLAANARGDALRGRLNDVFHTTGLEDELTTTGVGSMLCVHAGDDRMLELLFHRLLDEGFYIARRGFMSLSLAITDHHCDQLVEATLSWCQEMAQARLDHHVATVN